MNRLMMMLNGGAMRYMDENNGNGGEGGGAPANGGEGNPPANGGEGGEAKPFLGDPKGGEGGAKGDPSPKGGEGKGGEGQPKPATDDDYMKACVIDEKVVNLKGAALDQDLYKSMIPMAKELGVSPEALNKMANTLCAAQIERGKEAMKDRIEYFNKMKGESMQKYSQKDFETINAGIDRWFKPNGIMNNVIRNSELGADPEFLSLMFELGKRAQTDDLAGAGAGGGGSSVDPNGIQGLAKMW